MTNQLPLREILVDFESGSRPKGGVRGIRDGVPSLGGEHLDSDGSFNFQNVRFVPTSFAESMTRGHVKSGDILVVKDGATSGKVSLVRNNFPYKEAVINEHLFRLRVVESYSAEYVHYFLFSRSGQTQILSDFRGVAQGGISQGFVDKVFIPLVSPKQQQIIVEKIEELLSEVEASIKELESAQKKLKLYRASVLNAACSGKLVPTEAELAKKEKRSYETGAELLTRILKERREKWNGRGKYKEPALPDTSKLVTLPEGWTWSTLGQAFEVFVGATPSRARSDYWGGDISWVSSGEVAFCSITKTRETITEAGLENSSTTVHPIGTIMLGMIGEGKTRGQVATLKIPAAHNQNTAAIRVSNTEVPPEYVYRFLEGQYEKTRSIGAGNNQQALNKKIIEQIAIPLPPIAELRRIVAVVEKTLSIIDSTEKNILTNLLRATRLRQSILEQAFSGKLVPQDPSDEPASVLLEKIRAEREKATSEKKAPRGRKRVKKA